MAFEAGGLETSSGTASEAVPGKQQGCATWKVAKFTKSLAVESFLAWRVKADLTREHLPGPTSKDVLGPLW